MHHILLISSGVFHPPLLGRLRLQRILAALPEVSVSEAPSIEALRRLEPATFSAVALYYHAKRISPSAFEALDCFAREGGGILAVHSATASFKTTGRYTDILGGRFTGHPPVGPLAINAASDTDEVFGVVPPFTIKDEAYRHDLRDGVRVHFMARTAPRGRGQSDRRGVLPSEETPFVWTRRHDAGRVCYVGAGHCAASLCHASIIRILQAGLRWVCGAVGEVTP